MSGAGNRMSTLIRRSLDRIDLARVLLKGGATLGGTALYFLRHLQRDSYNQINLKSGLSMVAPLNEPLLQMLNDIWIKRCYTPAGFEIAAGDTVVDLGANVGAFAMYAATIASGVKVVGLEPSPRMFEVFQQNVARNSLHQVTPVHAAGGGKSGSATLYTRGFEGGNSLYPQDNAGRSFQSLATVRVLSLEEIFRMHGIEVCHFLKLCCPGAEYEILFEAPAATLQRIRRISMEYHLGLNDHTVQEMAVFLERLGFEVTYTPPYDEECGFCYARQRG
jgi:FkbM family methyltransferase